MYTCRIFFFNDTATTEIYTLSLHDALPIWPDNNGLGLMTALIKTAQALPNVTILTFGSACARSEEHTSELQSPDHLVCRLLLEKKKQRSTKPTSSQRSHQAEERTQISGLPA